MKSIANYESMAKEIVNWTKEMVESYGTKDAIVIMNGDRDAAIVANILVKALGEDHVIGLVMPYEPSMDCSRDKNLAREAGLKKIEEVNVTLATQAIEATATIACKDSLLWLPSVEIISRARFLVAQTLASQLGAVVVSSMNLSDYYIGNFVLWGNLGVIAPLGKLTSTEVRVLGQALGLSEDICDISQYDDAYKQNAEAKMGLKYSDLDSYIRGGTDLAEGVKQAIEDRIARNEYKGKLINMPSFHPALVQ